MKKVLLAILATLAPAILPAATPVIPIDPIQVIGIEVEGVPAIIIFVAQDGSVTPIEIPVCSALPSCLAALDTAQQAHKMTVINLRREQAPSNETQI